MTQSETAFEIHDSLFYCVPNMPGAVPYTMTIADNGWKGAARVNPAFADGRIVYQLGG